MSNLNWFWDLDDEEIKYGIYLRDTLRDTSNNRPHDYGSKIYKICCNYGFATLSMCLQESGFDRTLMKLRYADEIAAIEKEIQKAGITPYSYGGGGGIRI